MRKALINQRGVASIVEVMVTGVLTALAVGLIAMSAGSLFRVDAKTRFHTSKQADLMTAVAHVIKVGRHATTCAIRDPATGVAFGGELRCTVDFGHPPTVVAGDDEQVRFRFDFTDKKLLFERFVSGAWKELVAYEHIESFVICDDVDMQSGNCGLLPQDISQQHSRNLAQDATNILIGETGTSVPQSFFRFSLAGFISLDTGKEEKIAPVQSAFFVRNRALTGGLIYEWGNVGE